MDILYIANARMPTEKAHGLQIVKTVEALLERGENVVLLLPKRLNPITESIGGYYSLKRPIEVEYITIPFNFVLKMSDSLYFKLERLYFALCAFLNAVTKNVVVYSRDITLCFLLALFGKDVVYEDHEPKNSKKFLYKLFLKKINKKVIVAKNLSELYKEFGINESTFKFIPNGVDLAEFERTRRDKSIWWEELDVDHREKIVLYVGHFYTWKGVYTLIDAAQSLQNAKAVLIGGTEQDHQKVGDYIKERDIKNVYLHKFVPHKEIVKFIKSADVLVLPNTGQEERSLKYTTPIKLFEYMASGVPIAASRVESFKNYLENNVNAVMFEPDNAEDLANKINSLLNSSDLMEKMAVNAYQEVQDYSWERRAEKIIDFIKK